MNFDMQKYLAGSTVVCDSCGQEINVNETIKTRVIAKDEEGFDVVEEFFTCGSCGRHYTVTVIDKEMRGLIQQRRQLQKQLKLHIKIRSREKTIKKVEFQEEAVKRKQIQLEERLKKKYGEVCGND